MADQPAEPTYGLAFALPWPEQIAFLRDKLNVPTLEWDDILKAEHDAAFVVAGVAKADLLADLHDAVTQAVTEGTPFNTFKRQFNELIERHGWEPKGGKDFRAQVIYQTNIATSYAAGRYEQLTHPNLQAVAPLWMYRHTDGLMYPRLVHVGWNYRVAPSSDAWWKTHYPPNGWGCHCYVRAVNQRQAAEQGNGPPPDDGTYEYVHPKTGEIVTLPKGIDYGWDYAPGSSVVERLRELARQRAADLPAPLGSALRRDVGG